MSQMQVLRKRVRRIEQSLPKDEPEIVVTMWCPDGKAPPYRGGGIRIIASNPSSEQEVK